MTSKARAALIARADSAAAQGDLVTAVGLLEQAQVDDDAAGWLKLAGLRRGLRQPRRALEAVHRALAVQPLDFVALALRAQLLQTLEPAQAGEAWSEALSQRPIGVLPAALERAVATGEVIHRRWLAQKAQVLSEAGADLEPQLSDDELSKISRFRDNILHKSRIWHSQPTHFHYPGLTEREFHPRTPFPWLSVSIGVQSGPPIGAQKGPPLRCEGRLILGAGFALLAA